MSATRRTGGRMHRRQPNSSGVDEHRDIHLTRLSFLAVWAPIIILELYLALTVFVFFFGPVHWDVPSVPKLLTFLVINYGALLLGYSWGTSTGRLAMEPVRVAASAPD